MEGFEVWIREDESEVRAVRGERQAGELLVRAVAPDLLLSPEFFFDEPAAVKCWLREQLAWYTGPELCAQMMADRREEYWRCLWSDARALDPEEQRLSG
jgi:hypothetical protein